MSYGRRTYEYTPEENLYNPTKETSYNYEYGSSAAKPSLYTHESQRTKPGPFAQKPNASPEKLQLPQLPPINHPSLHRLVFTKPDDNGIPSSGTAIDNSTLVWLGEEYLNMIISDYLYDCCLKYSTSDLSNLRSMILSNDNITTWCEYYNLPGFMQMISQVKLNRFIDQKTYVDLFKAYLAGVIKTNDLNVGKDWIIGIVHPLIKDFEQDLISSTDNSSMANEEVRHAKEELYKIINPTFKPTYEVLEMTTPPDLPYFKIACVIQNKIIGIGQGQNKKIAGSKAAYSVLRTTKIKFDKNSSQQQAVEKLANHMSQSGDFTRREYPKVVRYDHFAKVYEE